MVAQAAANHDGEQRRNVDQNLEAQVNLILRMN